MSAYQLDMSAYQSAQMESTAMKPDAEGGRKGHYWGRTRVSRYLLPCYLVFVHVIICWLIWDPSIVGRVSKFLTKSPSVQLDYRGMVAAHSVITQSLPDESVVFLGDSRMRELDTSAIVDGPAYNLSIGGDTTRGLLERLRHYHKLSRCRMIVINVGVNDLSHFSDEESVQTYKQVLHFLEEAGVRKVVICSIIPIDETKYRQANASWFREQRTTNARIESYNRSLRALCGQFPFSRFAEASSGLVDPSGNLRAELTSDGLHLNDAGNHAWTGALRRAVNTQSRN